MKCLHHKEKKIKFDESYENKKKALKENGPFVCWNELDYKNKEICKKVHFVKKRKGAKRKKDNFAQNNTVTTTTNSNSTTTNSNSTTTSSNSTTTNSNSTTTNSNSTTTSTLNPQNHQQSSEPTNSGQNDQQPSESTNAISNSVQNNQQQNINSVPNNPEEPSTTASSEPKS